MQKRLLYETERTAYDAQQWLDAHRADFKGKVFNPVRMEISVKNPKLADLAEGPITRASAAVSESPSPFEWKLIRILDNYFRFTRRLRVDD